MTNQLKTEILTGQTTMIPTGHTRIGYTGTSTLDHVYTTHPQKMQVTVDNKTTSDHAIITVRRYCKQIPQTPKYRKLEGTAAYGRLLLAPAEGWWPSATWRALRALLIPPPPTR